MFVYKVTVDGFSSIATGNWKKEYQLNIPTLPEPGSLLFAFVNYEAAHDYARSFAKYEIWRCKVEVSDFNPENIPKFYDFLWNSYWQDQTKSTWSGEVPDGTIFCNSITPILKLTSRDNHHE